MTDSQSTGELPKQEFPPRMLVRGKWKRSREETLAVRSAEQREYRRLHPDRELESARKYRATHPGKAGAKATRYKRRYPERTKAGKLLRLAIAAGEIVRPENCSDCGKQCKPDGHHEDYSKPLKVRWLCRPCHKAADMKRKWRRAHGK